MFFLRPEAVFDMNVPCERAITIGQTPFYRPPIVGDEYVRAVFGDNAPEQWQISKARFLVEIGGHAFDSDGGRKHLHHAQVSVQGENGVTLEAVMAGRELAKTHLASTHGKRGENMHQMLGSSANLTELPLSNAVRTGECHAISKIE